MRHVKEIMIGILVTFGILGAVYAPVAIFGDNANSNYIKVSESRIKSVVGIYQNRNGMQLKGTGYVFKSNEEGSLIVTNYHVCNLKEYLRSRNDSSNKNIVSNDDKFFKSKIVAKNGKKDICFLHTDKKIISMPTSKDDDLYTGQPVNALTMIKSGSITRGVYIGDIVKDNPRLLKKHVDSKIGLGKVIKGDSGSPVIDRKMEVVGVVWGTLSKSNIFFFMPSDMIWEVYKDNNLKKYLN